MGWAIPAQRIHQQNVHQSGSHRETSQTPFWSTSPVFLNTSSCSQDRRELSKVLPDSPRAFPGAPESTCSYGGVFRMLWFLTNRIFKFWSCWDLCAGLQKTSRAAGSSVQVCMRLCAASSQQWFWGFHNHKASRLSYSSLLQSQASHHHNMPSIMHLNLFIYIRTVNLTADGTWAQLEEHMEPPIERT